MTLYIHNRSPCVSVCVYVSVCVCVCAWNVFIYPSQPAGHTQTHTYIQIKRDTQDIERTAGCLTQPLGDLEWCVRVCV